MKDTPPDVARRYRELLMRRSGPERLLMSFAMFEMARGLVRARLTEESAVEVRRELFLRLYGRDFPPDEVERILDRLGTVTE